MKTLSERIKDFPADQFVDWLCLSCVDVREVRNEEDAQDEINKIRKAVTERITALEKQRDALAAELIPEGYVLVPQTMHLSADAMESLCFHCGDGGFAFGDFTDGLLWVGDIENDDGTKTYGLNIATAEYPEEGSANVSEFAAQLRAGKDGE